MYKKYIQNSEWYVLINTEKVLTQTSQRLTSRDKIENIDNSFLNKIQKLRTSLSKNRKSIETKQIMLDLSLAKQEC